MIKDYNNKIEIGHKYKYSELCKIFEENEKKNATGTSSKAEQFDDWHRYFNWEKQGWYFTITEIFEEPKTKNQTSKRGKYINYFGYILLEILKQNGNEIIMYKNQLMDQMHIKSYPYIQYFKNEYDEYIYDINYEINKIFNSCINQMQNKGLIKAESTFEFLEKDFYTNRSKLVELTPEEITIYQRLQEDAYFYVALDLDLEPDDTNRIKRYLSTYKQWNKYNQKLKELTDKKFTSDIHKRFKVTLINDAIYDVNPDTVYDDLNNVICDRLHKIADKSKNSEQREAIKAIANLNCTTYKDYNFVYGEDKPYELWKREDDNTFSLYDSELDKDYTGYIYPISAAENYGITFDTSAPETNTSPDDLEILYQKYNDDSDEEYIPDGTTPF